MQLSELALVVLAAGQSTRFSGGDKLVAKLGGKPLCAHIADTGASLAFSRHWAVCPSVHAERAAIFRSKGFGILQNSDPGQGISGSIAIGAAQARREGLRGLVLCLADMPFVSADHIARLAAALNHTGSASSLISVHEVTRMPPSAFSEIWFEQMQGGSVNFGMKALIDISAELPFPDEISGKDFDTLADFCSLEAKQQPNF